MSNGAEPNFQEYYAEESFWDTLRRHALDAGEAVVERALALYYCARDDATPTWARGIIYGAIGYFILPIDAIPDAIPVIGYSDDLGVLAAAIAAVAAHVRQSHTDQARETLRQWFS